ncbi:hypothetical protein L248_1683 [Schleiferilactobacillus shenzhenensis LY-73]|uniref:Uncharacterized protein n=2 Tax=Schleiferilactobacillus shenzhenensis TaxID=1231337 RepID=U4TGX0_9LACO|nr:hypothetical protein L248_1683 [Schleiferilactobacillus shenzhenensis LY-73]
MSDWEKAITIGSIHDAYDFSEHHDDLPEVLKQTGGHAVLIQYTETELKPKADPTDPSSDWQDF